MRIVLTSHLPPSLVSAGDSVAGLPLASLAAGLTAAGHEVRVVMVLDDPQADDGLPATVRAERIICRPHDPAADLPFNLPAFDPGPAARQTFQQLSDSQLGAYRDCLRRRLDACIEAFDPHLIHCQQLWLFGHLALESGAPYLMTAQGPELQALQADPRCRRPLEEAVENAGGILASNTQVRAELLSVFPEAAELVLLEPTIDRFTAIYQAILRRRFGPSAPHAG